MPVPGAPSPLPPWAGCQRRLPDHALAGVAGPGRKPRAAASVGDGPLCAPPNWPIVAAIRGSEARDAPLADRAVAVAACTRKAAPWPAGIAPTREYEAAYAFLKDGAGHLFVTGRAGTGKSTLLTCLRELLPDELVVLAPTGLAAINVGGQTIHSFFGFPPRLIRLGDIRRSRHGRLMRRLKFLVIDEVSMVRSDLMWAI